MSDNQTPAPEAGDEVVSAAQDAAAPEAVESTQGQEASQPAEGEGGTSAPEEDVSPSKARRERRKAEMARLKDEAADKDRQIKELTEKLSKVDERAAAPAPNIENFDTVEDYQAALGAYHAMKALDNREKADIETLRAAQQAEMDSLQQRQQQEAVENWTAQIEDAKTRYSDFEKVVANPALSISRGLAELLITADSGADVAYHLGTNPAEALRISQLSPIEQAMEVGRISATLTIPKPNTQTNAPDPIKPVRPKAASGPKRWEDMSADEFDKWRAEGGKITL